MAKAITVLGILATLLAEWVVDEIRAWLPWCARRFFDLSLRLLPPSERERYGEEWLSHIESFPGSSVTSAHFVWAALSIRVFVTMNVFCERWTRLRDRTILFGVLSYFWVAFRISRILGVERSMSSADAAQNSNLLMSVFLILVCFVLLRELSETRPRVLTGSLT